MFTEDELIPISALQHAMYCERQVALIHIEQLWRENLYTAEGRILHERVDKEHHESRRARRAEYGMAVRSLEHGLIGKADLVEFEKSGTGKYAMIRPVEFKRGKTKPTDMDNVQLCAQALCLEEMFGTGIPEGQFYYLQEHRRSTVAFDQELRDRTQTVIRLVQQLFLSTETPQAEYRKQKCDRCSLYELCMPRATSGGGKRVPRYVANQLRLGLKEEET
ncbi:CRISPR-associated protein Cas4 [Alkalispirochaeta sphaeroplastigenens]|nr:CRISPR-associated protein Cas4 [Alkalispirochaeta sphaeroplastigenens]